MNGAWGLPLSEYIASSKVFHNQSSSTLQLSYQYDIQHRGLKHVPYDSLSVRVTFLQQPVVQFPRNGFTFVIQLVNVPRACVGYPHDGP